MSRIDTLRAEYQQLQQEATILAGGLTALTQRATVYRQLFRDAGRNHIFPLIAAHGALWARGYFQWGLSLGRKLVWQYFYSATKREEQLAALDGFADAFRDINRRVCVDTYANFHFTARHGAASEGIVSPELLAALLPLHEARRAGHPLTDRERYRIFEAHFLDEQRRVVGPSIDAALARFDWPLLRCIALRPVIRFAFFPHGSRLWFRDFSSREDRIEKGHQAFDIGSAVGWNHVEASLANYHLLTPRFFAQPETNYAELRDGLLALPH